ncbi:MAG: RSP_7527 family protein [Paracoccaceae bacterium]
MTDQTALTQLNYFEIERQARVLRAQAAQAGVKAASAWMKAKFHALTHLGQGQAA